MFSTWFFFLTGAAQSQEFVFPPSKEPAFITIPGKSSTEPFSLVPGTWTVSIMAEEVLLVRKQLRKTTAWGLSWYYCSGVTCWEEPCKQVEFSTSEESISCRIQLWKSTLLPLFLLWLSPALIFLLLTGFKSIWNLYLQMMKYYEHAY